jgi:hypothetical protein
MASASRFKRFGMLRRNNWSGERSSVRHLFGWTVRPEYGPVEQSRPNSIRPDAVRFLNEQGEGFKKQAYSVS